MWVFVCQTFFSSGDEPGPSQSNDFQEQHQYIPPDVRHDQNSRSSLYDQLPNSIGEQSVNEQDHLQQPVIGNGLVISSCV